MRMLGAVGFGFAILGVLLLIAVQSRSPNLGDIVTFLWSDRRALLTEHFTQTVLAAASMASILASLILGVLVWRRREHAPNRS